MLVDEDLFAYVNYDSVSITSFLNQLADTTFAAFLKLHLPQAPRELVKILWALLFWSFENRKRSFSFLNWIHNRLRPSILTDLLGAFFVISMHGQMILVLKINICNAYMSIHPHRIIFWATLSFVVGVPKRFKRSYWGTETFCQMPPELKNFFNCSKTLSALVHYIINAYFLIFHEKVFFICIC